MHPFQHVARAVGPDQPAASCAAVLAAMMVALGALGVPGELVLQDTLKSTVVASGVLLAGLVFFWRWQDRTRPLAWHGLLWLPCVLLSYALGSTLWSHAWLATVEAIRWFLLGLLLWLSVNTLGPTTLPRLAWGICLGAVCASLWAALQFWLDVSLFPQAAAPASSFANRNFLAEYLVCCLPFSCYLLAAQSRLGPALALGVGIALQVLALLMTGTRSALLALVLVLPLMVLMALRFRRTLACASWAGGPRALVCAAFLATLTALGSVPSGSPQILAQGLGQTALERGLLRGASMVRPAEYGQGSFAVRSVMWRSTARMLLANRWTGVGAGAWEVHIPLYQNSDQGYEDDYFAHNEYLQLLAEYGLPVGGLAIAFLLAYLLQSAGRTWHVQAQYESEGPLRWTALVSLLALALVCLAGFPLHLAATGALLALCLALLGGSDVRLGSPQLGIVSARAGPIVRSAALVLLICASLLAAGISVQAMRAERLLVQVVQRGNGILASGLPASAAPNQDRLRLMALQVRAGVAIAPHYRKLSALGADQLAKWGDWETAAWVWRSVLASRPWLAAMWANLARAELQLGDYPAAYSALQQWLALQPGSGDANALLVDLLERMGRAEGALRE